MLRYRPADAVAWKALAEAPGENRGFREAQAYVFERPGPGWSLNVDDEKLLDVVGDPNSWRWSARFFAGEVTAELMRPDGARATVYLLDVAPDPSKVGRDMFRQMLDELWSADPMLVVGTEPATNPIGELGTTEDPWLAFARLRRFGPEFFRSLVLVRERPRRVLRTRRDSTPLHHARRVDRTTATTLVRTAAVALMSREHSEPVTLPQGSRLDVPVIEETVDSAANRCLLALLRALQARVASLKYSLAEEVKRESESDTRTPLADRWPERRRCLEEMARELRIAARRPPFPSVGRAEVTAAGLTAIAADPSYSRAWGRGWRALRSGVESTPSDERLWISPSWEIYERWCFIRIGALLTASSSPWNWSRAQGSRCWVGEAPGRRAKLWLQPVFASRETPIPGMWSVSRRRVPDLVLVVHRGSEVRFVVLDAKYRVTRSNVLEAMESAHIYQDSLRIGSVKPHAALLLVPSGGGAGWLEDEAFQAEHRVGVHVFSPGGETSLPAIAQEVLND